MIHNKTDSARQDSGERKPSSIALLGLHFRRHSREDEARVLQTEALTRDGARRRTSRVRLFSGAAAPHPRLKPATYTSRGETGEGRQKILMALIPALAIALLYLLKNPLARSTPVTAQDKPPVEATPVEISDVQIAWEIPPVYQPGGRDPMRLPAEPVATAEELEAEPTQPHMDLIVTGILYSEDRPAAIIDTFLVHEGEQISGATIQKIEKDGVEFEMNGRTWKQTVEVGKR